VTRIEEQLGAVAEALEAAEGQLKLGLALLPAMKFDQAKEHVATARARLLHGETRLELLIERIQKERVRTHEDMDGVADEGGPGGAGQGSMGGGAGGDGADGNKGMGKTESAPGTDSVRAGARDGDCAGAESEPAAD